MGHVTLTTPLSGTVCQLAMYSIPTKFEVYVFTCYEDMKGDTKCSNTKCRNLGGLEYLGVTVGISRGVVCVMSCVAALSHSETPFRYFGTIPACNRRTDGRTQGHSIYRASIASLGKNQT